MANTARVRGFVPAKSLVGTPWQGLVRQYEATNPANGIYIGDPVTLSAGKVVRAATNNEIVGVVVGVGANGSNFGQAGGYFDANNLGKRYLSATDSGVVAVVPASLVLFTVFDDGVDRDLVVGSNADILPGTGSTTTGNSAYRLTAATNNDLKVVEQVTKPSNDRTLANAEYMVQFCNTEHLAVNV